MTSVARPAQAQASRARSRAHAADSRPPADFHHRCSPPRLQKAKFKASEFGACPRTLCEKQTVLPVGLSDSVSLSGENPMKLFCPRW